MSKDKRNEQPKKLKGIVAEEDSDPKTIKEALINISSKEKLILERVYLKINKSLEQLNTKTEDYIMSELNSFNNEQT